MAWKRSERRIEKIEDEKDDQGRRWLPMTFEVAFTRATLRHPLPAANSRAVEPSSV